MGASMTLHRENMTGPLSDSASFIASISQGASRSMPATIHESSRLSAFANPGLARPFPLT